MDKSVQVALDEFLGSFALVFNEDWDYSKYFFENEGVSLAGEGTFLNPSIDPASCNWGNRANLLRSYTALLTALAESKKQI